MTYKEAIAHKNECMKTVMETGNNYLYLILPELLEDRAKFDIEYDQKTYTDELCKKFSSNKQYVVIEEMDKDSVNREDRKSKNQGK